MAPYLTIAGLTEALAQATAASLEPECFSALAALVRHLPSARRSTVAQQALTLLSRFVDHRLRETAVAALAPVLRPEEAVRALRTLPTGGPSDRRAVAIDALVPVLPDAVLPEALDLVLARTAMTGTLPGCPAFFPG
ncbi:hypothetical protein J7F03_19695 [Streptomyces sp. ISL-43]|uniref:hypothetical protein n=1 Tax=Streptomyces sp. ISL-43 TaxID=2819183 RepID=UPI001BEC7CAF|nr:hypothetical protein [Streptomyces sp. ISL-43]MBT2449276.1 hypothetical protein [Streptomyces sp. ISL-43]